MKKTVKLEGRTFMVFLDEQGQPQRIYERKLFAPGTHYECWFNRPYWHAKHHQGHIRPTSIVSRLIKEVGASHG